MLKKLSKLVLASAMVFSIVTPLQAEENQDATYKIYPAPHTITYDGGSYDLGSEWNVIYDEGIDQDTKNRLAEVAELKDVKVTVSDKAKANVTNIYVGIDGSNGPAETYIEANATVESGLFEKTDAYYLESDDNEIFVLGAHTDASFYGLTTLYHVVKQLDDTTISNFTINDYADVVSRGFIEGYYGEPWSTQDRINLMTWGGYYKLNTYFYAPKDDPKHNAKWRELYTDEEIATKVKPLADAGNASKCRFVYALHPYMNSPIRYSTEENYQADLAIMKAKFLQVIDAGVREIAILADDAGNVGGANYIKTLEDMSEWLEELKATKYPDLKTVLPFCTQEYMYNGQSYYTDFPENVQIIMTGGKIWGECSQSFLDTFYNNTQRSVFLWMNWPCSDNSKNHLIMGGNNTFLHEGVTSEKLDGIMLNPMQQSEPSKVAIFANANYTWNLWESEEEGTQTWEDCFSFVNHNSAIPNAASDALKEMSKHMQNQNMDSRVTALEESVELAPKLRAYTDAVKAGSVTVEMGEALKEEFFKLKEAAETYMNEGNEDIRNQIIFWLECWLDTCDGMIFYIDAVNASIEGDADGVLNNNAKAKAAFDRSKTHGFSYIDHIEYAEVGVQHIVPTLTALKKEMTKKTQALLDPNYVSCEYITSRTDTPQGGEELAYDSSDSTAAIYQTPNEITTGTYVGMLYSKVMPISDFRVVLGAGKDHFDAGKLEYTMDGKTWQDLPLVGMTNSFTGTLNQKQEVAITAENLPENFKAMGIRFIATADNANDAWLEVRMVEINKTATNIPTASETYSGSVTYTGMSVQNGNVSNLFDGDGASEMWYAADPYSGDLRDKVPANATLTVTFDSPKTIGTLGLTQGASAAGDVYSNAKWQYQVDGSDTWVDAGNINNAAEQTVNVGAVENVKAVRILNVTATAGWLRLGEIKITSPLPVVEDNSNVFASEGVDTSDFSVAFDDNKASLSANSITLAKGQYIGIKFDNVKEITYADTVANDCGVYYTINPAANEWKVFDSAPVDARYVVMVANADATINIEKFEVGFKAYGDYAIDTDLENYNSGDDVRTTDTLKNIFDNNLGTLGKVNGPQMANGYIQFDLGQTIHFDTFRYYLVETNLDYIRAAKFEISNDLENWTEILNVDATDAAHGTDTVAKDCSYMTHDPRNPGNMYVEATDINKDARYIKITFTKTFTGRWVNISELQINGGQYVSKEANKDIIASVVEEDFMIPTNALDKDFETTYKPSETNGEFVYRVSEEDAMKTVRMIQEGETSNAKVTLTTLTNEEVEAGELSKVLNVFYHEDGIKEVKVEWTSRIPEISEIQVFADEMGETNPVVFKNALLVAISECEALDSTAYTEASWAKLEEAANAGYEVLEDANATQDEVDAAVKAINDAVAALEKVKEEPTPDPKPAMNFVDVKEGAWFYGSVESAYQKGLMSNTGKGKEYFEPDTAISRGMVATVLYRMAGLPKVEFKATFSDVTNPKLWYSTAITWASQANVVSGYKDGSFGPDDNITRQDLAIMLRNFAKANGLNTNAKVDFSAFKDGNKVVSYAQSAVQFCIDAKLMSGSKKADGVYLNPTDKATRAECAKMFSLLDDAIKANAK